MWKVEVEDFGIYHKVVEDIKCKNYRLLKLFWKARYMKEPEFSRWLVYSAEYSQPITDAVHYGGGDCLTSFYKEKQPSLVEIEDVLEKAKKASDTYDRNKAEATEFVAVYQKCLPRKILLEVISDEVVVRGIPRYLLKENFPELESFWKFSLDFRFKVSEKKEFCLEILFPFLREHFGCLTSGKSKPKLRKAK